MSAIPATRPRLRGLFHLAAIPVAVAAAIALVQRLPASDPWAVASVSVFAVFLVALYTTSATYHLGRWSVRAKYIWSRLDVAIIQLFIAASFTPMAYHSLDGGWRTWSLAVAWTVVGVGAVIAASPLTAPRWLATGAFIAIGWLSVVPFSRMLQGLDLGTAALIVLGGLLYTVGAFVYARQWPDPWPRWFGFHEIFHLFVVAASTAHYLAIWQQVV